MGLKELTRLCLKENSRGVEGNNQTLLKENSRGPEGNNQSLFEGVLISMGLKGKFTWGWEITIFLRVL